MTGHSAHDDAGYVPRELFEEWKAKDPIVRYQKLLLSEGLLSEEDVNQIQRAAVEWVDRAVEWAQKCPYPDPEDCLKDVYYEG